jgi:hypothetical protein
MKRNSVKSNEGLKNTNYNLTEENVNKKKYTLSYKERKKKRIIKAFEDNNSIGKELINNVYSERGRNNIKLKNRPIFKTFDFDVKNKDIYNLNLFSYGKTYYNN